MFQLQAGKQIAPHRGDSMAVRAIAEMIAAMKKVEVGVLDAERTAASERDLRKQTEARAAEAEARASDAEAARDRLRQELDEWKAKAAGHQQGEKEAKEKLELAVAARRGLEKRVAELSTALEQVTQAHAGLEAELEMTRQQLQEAAAFAGWGQTPGRAALRWGSTEWWAGGGRVGVAGAGAAPHAQAPAVGSSFARGADSASVHRNRAQDLEAELVAAAHERERLARDLGVVFDRPGGGSARDPPPPQVVGSGGGWTRDDAARFI